MRQRGAKSLPCGHGDLAERSRLLCLRVAPCCVSRATRARRLARDDGVTHRARRNFAFPYALAGDGSPEAMTHLEAILDVVHPERVLGDVLSQAFLVSIF